MSRVYDALYPGQQQSPGAMCHYRHQHPAADVDDNDDNDDNDDVIVRYQCYLEQAS